MECDSLKWIASLVHCVARAAATTYLPSYLDATHHNFLPIVKLEREWKPFEKILRLNLVS